MGPASQRRITAAAAVVAAFVFSAAILLRVVPSPHTRTDYLMVGTGATLIALAVLFAVLGGMGAWRGKRR